MKQTLLTLAVVCATAFTALSQQTPLQDFIDKYRHEKAFSYAFLSKDMFEVATQSSITEKDWKQVHQIVRNIGSLSVLAADSISDGPALYKEALHAVPVDVFDELLTVQDGKDRVRIWVKTDANAVTDLVLLVGTADEFVLVCFAGNLELNNITDLTKLLDADAVQDLAKTSAVVAAEFSISPNPSSGTITVQYTEKDDQPEQLTLLDQTGRQLSVIHATGENNQTVNLPELPNGLYWIQLKSCLGKVGVKQLQIIK